MLCTAIRLFSTFRSQNQNLSQLVKNASISTSFLPQLSKKGLWGHNFYQNQTERYCTCYRADRCKKKKQEEAAKKIAEEKKPKYFWSSFFAKPPKKPPLETCRRLQTIKQWEEEKIPDFITEMCKDLPEGSCLYRTEGHAFILEVPCKRYCERKKTRAEVFLSKIERDKQGIILEDENNPMPRYTSCGQRLIDLQARKLHPLYKKLEMPQSTRAIPYKLETKSRCPLPGGEFKKLTTWEQYLRTKINFSNFKMSVLPRYLQMREKEYEKNLNSSFEVRKEKMRICKGGPREYRFNPMTDCPKIDCERWTHQKPRHKINDGPDLC